MTLQQAFESMYFGIIQTHISSEMPNEWDLPQLHRSDNLPNMQRLPWYSAGQDIVTIF